MAGGKAMNQELELKIQEFSMWAIGSGTYEATTTRAAVRSLRFMAKRFDILKASPEDVISFVYYQRSRQRNTKTIENQLQALLHFQQMLGKQITVPKLKRKKSAEQWVPSPDDLGKVFDYVDSIKSPVDKAFKKSLVYALAYTGARIGEIARLNVSDVMDSGIYIRAEKNEQNRTITVSQDVMDEIKKWLKFRPTVDNAFFAGRNGRLSPDRLRMIVKEIGQKSGVPRMHSHAFRHAVATALLNEGMDIKQVQLQLGHSSLKSTEAYVHPDHEMVSTGNAEALNRFFRKVEKMTGDRMHMRANKYKRGERDSNPRSHRETA
jgi:integrase